jgi:VanZ family protein
MSKSGVRSFLAFLPASLYYGLVFYFSSRNIHIPIEAAHADKGLHLAEFAVLGILLASGWFRVSESSLKFKAFAVLTSGLVLGVIDELHQLFVPGRNADPLDALADTLGIALGLTIYILWHSRRGKSRERPVAARRR